MSCTILSNLTLSCADEVVNGGFSKIYLKSDAEIASVTFGVAPAHTVTAVTTVSDAKFVEFQGRFGTKSLSSEATKENGGISIVRTLEVFVPKVEKAKAEILQGFMSQRGVAGIIEMYESTGTYKQGLFVGYDKKLGADAFLKATVNEMVEATIEGQNGYMVTFVGNATELVREFIGTITVEDGATGTDVQFGS